VTEAVSDLKRRSNIEIAHGSISVNGQTMIGGEIARRCRRPASARPASRSRR
jgi:hypothetical protein